MHRSLFGAAAAATTLSLSLLPAAAHAAGAPIMYLGDVRAGMQCTVSSVVQGLEPTTFDATVLSVAGGPRPADAMIIARFSGDAIKDTGIGQGFSGSPVSCPGPDGVSRVIGALAAGIGQYDNFVAGITPIESMLATPTLANAPAAPPVGEASPKTGAAAPSKKSEKAAKSATGTWGAIPLTVSGPRGPLAAALQSAAAKAKFPLLIAPAAKRAQTAPAGGLKPGDAVAATIVTGDVTAGAIGTVTYVDGDKVWAFGHPFNGTGPSRITMERAQINAIITSPAIGDQVTYKLGEPVGPVGTIGFDGTAAIGGVLGAAPATIPLETTIRDGAGAVVQSATASIVDERPVRGGVTGALLPLAAATNAGLAMQRLTNQPAVGGAARTCTTILLKNNEKPLQQCSDAVQAEPDGLGGVELGVVDAVASAVSGITIGERFLRLVDRVKVDVTFRNEADQLEIVRVKAPKSIRAGKTATLRVVVVQGSTGDRREIPVKVKIPRYAAGQRTGIVVLADSLGGGGLSEDAFLEELFGEDGPVSGGPKTLEALRKDYTNDGLSGIRVAVLPGLSGSSALELLTGDSEEADLDDDEFEALFDQVKLVQELPTYALEGAAAATLRPKR